MFDDNGKKFITEFVKSSVTGEPISASQNNQSTDLLKPKNPNRLVEMGKTGNKKMSDHVVDEEMIAKINSHPLIESIKDIVRANMDEANATSTKKSKIPVPSTQSVLSAYGFGDVGKETLKQLMKGWDNEDKLKQKHNKAKHYHFPLKRK